MKSSAQRVNALIRRSTGHASPVLEFGTIALDTAAKTVSVQGEQLELTSFEYNTLEYLVHHAGKVISKNRINRAPLRSGFRSRQ